MFFFKKSQIVLDCFTHLPYAYDYAKIDNGAKFFPEWWKTTPKLIDTGERITATIKSCKGLIEYYKNSIVIPSWFGMEFQILSEPDEKGYIWKYIATNNDVSFENHSKEQFEGFCQEDGLSLKLTSPWRFKTNKFCNFVWSQPIWNNRSLVNKLTVLPGVLDFYYQHGTAINFFCTIPKTDITKVNIEPLSPLVILHPLHDKKIIIKNHLIDEKEYERINGIWKFIYLSEGLTLYRDKKRIKDNLDKSNCPFGK